MDKTLNINEIRDTIQDCNLNFLIGSGMSCPYLEILGNIEILLTDLASQKLKERERKIIEASLYAKYFDGVITKNIGILENDTDANKALENYKSFLQSINSILLNRRSTILSKQVNIVTTNIDIFLEKAIEDMGLEYNDGFGGRFSPVFNLSNFKKSTSRRSLHYDNTSEIPVFNLLKVHGSLTWEIESGSENIHFSPKLNIIRSINNKMVPVDSLLEIKGSSTIEGLISEVKKITTYRRRTIETFLEEYKKLLIINPTEEKFKHTLFNQTYYDLLRIYSNELEKENTVLFVMGFSFEDKHIRELTLRGANSNPTLTIYIFSRTTQSKEKFEKRINFGNVKNNNIKIITPTRVKSQDGKSENDEFEFNLQKINEKIFIELLRKIEEGKQENLI